MKDNQKGPEKPKMPRMLSLLIWHKGAWHQLILTDGFTQEMDEKNDLEDIGNPVVKEAIN